MKTVGIAFVIVGLAASATAGYFVGRTRAPVAVAPASTPANERGSVYTCSMHPQVRRNGPGTCPICGMPLVPAEQRPQGGGEESPMLALSDHALAMASVETVLVERRPLSRAVRAVGKIQYNESSLATITPRVDGYAERLFVNFTGIEIRAGDHVAEVYSPELLVAQQELLIALQAGTSGPLVATTKTKLRLLGLTDEQIADLVENQHVTERVTLYSPISGTVVEKMIVEHAAFKAGEPLYRIANLDSVWVYLEIYELELPWIRYGQKVQIAAEALPGRAFEGVVTFVQPVVNETTRTVRVPVHIENRDHALKPGMFVSATVMATLGPDGQAAPTGVEGKFSCPMHPQVMADQGGKCPICGMPLEEIPGAALAVGPGETVGLIAVPIEAVLDSGTRRIVYVEKSRGIFELREVVLGPRAGDYFPVLSGLEADEGVVTRGNFLIDSQFQITGHPSLFYPGGLRAGPGHQHGGQADPATAPAQPARHDH